MSESPFAKWKQINNNNNKTPKNEKPTQIIGSHLVGCVSECNSVSTCLCVCATPCVCMCLLMSFEIRALPHCPFYKFRLFPEAADVWPARLRMGGSLRIQGSEKQGPETPSTCSEKLKTACLHLCSSKPCCKCQNMWAPILSK